MKKLLSKVFFVFVFASVLVGAPSMAAGPGWIISAKITKIVIASNGGINVRLSPELSGCISQSGYGPTYASVYPDHPGLEKIHSIFLAAYVSDKPVAIYFSDSNCTVAEVELGGRLQ